jgi:UDP-N-acetylglucosamine--N-acetylmuramyl-(pentapeptide) pyrophosphoryl-undecaprenol N-acetylglucosamine transferase
VPYPHATARHQDANADAVVRAGGAVVVSDAQLDGEVVAGRITEIIDDPGRLGQMTRGAAGFGRPEAADALADLTARVAGARK